MNYEKKMSKDLEVLKADVKKLMLKDWTKTEVTKLDEFMEDVIIATMQVNKLPIHVVDSQRELLSFMKETHRLQMTEDEIDMVIYDYRFLKTL